VLEGQPTYKTLDEWVAREAISFSPDSQASLDVAVDRLVEALSQSVELLGLGETLHGGQELLVLRNRTFQRLVQSHGFTAIAIESSFPRGHSVNDYVAGRGAAKSFEDVRDKGFSHGFGAADTSRELVEWMRRHNADSPPHTQLRFYGFDSATEMSGPESPRQLLQLTLAYFDSIDADAARERHDRIGALLEQDWENPGASFDPAKSPGLSQEAAKLRIETEELITELAARRPELIKKSGADYYAEAMQNAANARLLLTYHAEMARSSPNRIANLLGIRDLTMAENLAYALERERSRGGKLFAFAHNMHLQRSPAKWQLGPHALQWWPAGAHVSEMLGDRYAVIGSAVGSSESHGLATPAPETFEAILTSGPDAGRFLPTRRGAAMTPGALASAVPRAAGWKNSSYFSLSAQSFSDFDAIAVFKQIG
jgi:erythromycin esterase-like protein